MFRSSAAVGVVIALLAAVALLPKSPDPGAAVGSEFNDASAPTATVEASTVPAHVRESAGTDNQYPHEYAGQPAVF
jgi:hypothetical protein